MERRKVTLTKWICKQVDMVQAQPLMTMAGMNPLLAKVLLSKGVTTAQDANVILHEWAKLEHNPFLMKDMDLAVAGILQALEQQLIQC